MNENHDDEIAAVVAEVEKAELAPGTRTHYCSSNYQYILWLMQHRPHLVHPELVAEVEEMMMTPLLTPHEKKINIRDHIKKVWLGEMYNDVRLPVRCDLLTCYDDVVSWYIEQKEPGSWKSVCTYVPVLCFWSDNVSPNEKQIVFVYERC